MFIECRHLFTSGAKCESPSLTGSEFCYFHDRSRNRKESPRALTARPASAVHHLPALEDADAIQLAISDVVLALAANRIDPRRAQAILYGLQIASHNAKQISIHRGNNPVREAYQDTDGSIVGPLQQQYDFGEIDIDEEEEDEEYEEKDEGDVEEEEEESHSDDQRVEESRESSEHQKHPQASTRTLPPYPPTNDGLTLQAAAFDTSMTQSHSDDQREEESRESSERQKHPQASTRVPHPETKGGKITCRQLRRTTSNPFASASQAPLLAPPRPIRSRHFRRYALRAIQLLAQPAITQPETHLTPYPDKNLQKMTQPLMRRS